RLRVRANAYRRLDEELIRAEHLLRSGKDPTAVQSVLERPAARFKELRDQRKAKLLLLRPRSLAEAVAQGQAPADGAATNEAREMLRDLAVRDARLQTSKNDKEAAEFQALRKKFLERFDKKFFDLAWTVFQTAVEEPRPLLQHLRTWNGLVGQALA